MNINPLFLTLFLFIGFSQLSFGQRPDNMVRMTPEQRLEQANTKIDSVVSLSNDQKTAVNFLHEELFLKDVPKRGSMRNMTDEQREAMRTQRQVKMRTYREGLSAVLSPEQQEKWKTFEESSRSSTRERSKATTRDRSKTTNRGRRQRGQ